jgi:hypothetical protein
MCMIEVSFNRNGTSEPNIGTLGIRTRVWLGRWEFGLKIGTFLKESGWAATLLRPEGTQFYIHKLCYNELYD